MPTRQEAFPYNSYDSLQLKLVFLEFKLINMAVYVLFNLLFNAMQIVSKIICKLITKKLLQRITSVNVKCKISLQNVNLISLVFLPIWNLTETTSIYFQPIQ